MKRFSLAIVLALSLAAQASAIDWPLQLSSAKNFGESTTTKELANDGNYILLRPTDYSPNAVLTTPFSLAAFAYANSKATYTPLNETDLAEISRMNSLEVAAFAFSKVLGANDDLVVVIKQNGKVITGTTHGKTSQSVTDNPEVGYSTTKSYRFPLSSFDTTQAFDVVIANVVTNGNVDKSEISWTINPATIR
jgi:hypothetical protein